MSYQNLFQIFIYHSAVHGKDISSLIGTALIDFFKGEGVDTYVSADAEQTLIAIEKSASIGAFLLDWDQPENPTHSTAELVNIIRQRGIDAPIFLISHKADIADIPNDVIGKTNGLLFVQEDTIPFLGRHVLRHFRSYIEQIKTPFFGGMIDYVEAGNEMWLAPGHNGGIFYEKSPIGKVFFDYLGEKFFRSDFNFVPDLGSIFDHTGPFLEAEQGAAKIFGADKTYFVLNGTSTSNKMVNIATIVKDDLVLFDRNNHKSHHQSALMQTGAIPIFMPNERNSFGMVGPLEFAKLNEDYIREQIRTNPLVSDKDKWQSERPIRMAIIENCTYDGTIYNVQTIVDKIGHLCDYIFFDEAWGAFMKFHPIYQGRFGLGLANLGKDDPGIYVTQSTHKQLAGISQASQIHKKDEHIDGQKRRVSHKRLNEVYMMYSSTSPFYPMFASLDVGAQMMKGKNGYFLWDQAIRLSIELAKKVRFIKRDILATETDEAKRWFFDPFVPDFVTDKSGKQVAWEEVPTDELIANQNYWLFKDGDSWHGYQNMVGDFAMKDPTKLLYITPGINRETGKYEQSGIPAAIFKEYIRDKGIIAEKSDFNSILFLLTPAIEKTKVGTLLSEMQHFKKLCDDNAPIKEVFPTIYHANEARYRGMGVWDLAQQLHNLYLTHDVDEIQKAMFKAEHFPEMAMTPRQAFQKFVANEVDYIPLAEATRDKRIAANLALVYPPGIGVIMPGERYDERAKPMTHFFEIFQQTNPDFPGFENEVQGLWEEAQDDGSYAYYTYVVKE